MTVSTSLGIFDVLNEVGRKNYFIWDQLTEVEQKTFHPLVLLKWMLFSGVSPIKLQEINHNFFNLSKPDQMVLLATAPRLSSNYKWKWCKNESKTADDRAITAIQSQYQVSGSTARSVLSLFSPEEIEELVQQEYGNTTASTKSSSSKKTGKKGT